MIKFNLDDDNTRIIIFGGYGNGNNKICYMNYNNNNDKNDLKWNEYLFFKLPYYQMNSFSYHNIMNNKNTILLIGGIFRKNENDKCIFSNEIWLFDFEKNKRIELLRVLIFSFNCYCLMSHIFVYFYNIN